MTPLRKDGTTLVVPDDMLATLNSCAIKSPDDAATARKVGSPINIPVVLITPLAQHNWCGLRKPRPLKTAATSGAEQIRIGGIQYTAKYQSLSTVAGEPVWAWVIDASLRKNVQVFQAPHPLSSTTDALLYRNLGITPFYTPTQCAKKLQWSGQEGRDAAGTLASIVQAYLSHRDLDAESLKATSTSTLWIPLPSDLDPAPSKTALQQDDMNKKVAELEETIRIQDLIISELVRRSAQHEAAIASLQAQNNDITMVLPPHPAALPQPQADTPQPQADTPQPQADNPQPAVAPFKGFIPAYRRPGFVPIETPARPPRDPNDPDDAKWDEPDMMQQFISNEPDGIIPDDDDEPIWDY